MKRISIIMAVIITAFILVNCEEQEIDTLVKNNEKQVTARVSRISFVKSGKIEADDKQQDFKLLYVNKQSNTEIAFLVEYKTGDEYKLHNFDVAWDGKLDADSEGKLWMNLKVYHKTYEEGAKNMMQDSAVVNIPDIGKFSNDTITKLWLKFINTTDIKNILTLQYQKPESTDNSSEDGETGESTTQDSTSANGSDSGTTTQDSTSTNSGNGGDSGTTSQDSTSSGSTGTNTNNGNNSGTTTQDSTYTNSGSGGDSGSTSQDSTSSGSTGADTNNGNNSGTTTQDSTYTNSGSGYDYGTTSQDSTGSGSTGTNTDYGNNSGTTTQDSTYTSFNNGGNNTGTTVQDSTKTNN